MSLKKGFIRISIAVLALVPLSASAQWSLKNNLLYDAALSFNAGVEKNVGNRHRWTLALGAGFSPFETSASSERRWRHLLVMPEARYWFCEAYSHHFLSVNALYSHYNASQLDLPLYATKDYRYQGDLVGLGASWGYAVPIGRHNHWNIEFELGADLAYTWFDKYECHHCGTKLASEDKWLVLPKLGVSLAWVLPSRSFNEERAHACDDLAYDNIPWASSESFTPAFTEVADNSGRAGQLQKDNPVLAHISKYRPYDNTRVLRKEKDMLYVHFPLGGMTLRPDYRNNAEVLDRIVDIARQIMSDSTSSVKTIQVIGLASIEGEESHNCELAQGRAEALRNYIEQQLPETRGLFELNNGCEAWAEFEDQVKDLRDNLPAGSTVSAADLSAVLDIIHSEPDHSLREQLIRNINGGQTFNYLRENVLSDQRNSGYLRIYYDYEPDEAARTINAASALMKEKRYTEALPMLQGVSNDVRAWNALGVCLYMTGKKKASMSYFLKAAKEGNQDAINNLKHLENHK